MEKERLLLCMSRCDHYYDSVNNKSNVFLVWATFIVGGLIATYSTLVEKVACNNWIYGLFILLIAIGIITILIVIRASAPYLKNQSESLIYFGSVSKISYVLFRKKSASRSEEEELDDLRQQVHELSEGLRKKFEKLKIVAWLFTAQFVLFIPFIILIINNIR